MSRIRLGSHIHVDVARLVETRMLIQANSGGGKSYAIRKLLEETHGEVQQIVLDMEGEFGTLREHFDYVLAGKGGDVDANPKTAELLARKVLELEVSLIVDLYELKKIERIRFVKNFVDALVNSPKELWHPLLIVIDEAHVFVPEKGESEAASAVVDLTTRGRKRGFAAVLATQRLSKLNKDVAAECLNKLIGRTSLDIDRKRAGDELGFIDARSSLSLRDLKPGDFYAFGPAISDAVALGKIGSVKTSHPKAGQRLGFKRTRPTAHIKAVLKKLDDLPKEAEAELKDKESLQRRIRELELEVRRKPVETRTEADPKAIERAVRATKKEIAKHVLKLNRSLLDAVGPVVDETIRKCTAVLEVPERPTIPDIVRDFSHLKIKNSPIHTPRPSGEPKVGACERAILGFLSAYPNKSFSKVQVGIMSGYRHTSSSFSNALSKLGTQSLIKRNAGMIQLDDAGAGLLIDVKPLHIEDWIAKLGKCERAIYERILEHPEYAYNKGELGEFTGYSSTSSSFNNALSKLNTLGLIRRERGLITLNPEIQNL